MYTKTVIYKEPDTLTYGMRIRIPIYDNRFAYQDSCMVRERHHKLFDHNHYHSVVSPLSIGNYILDIDKININVLRLLIKDKNSQQLFIPNELLGFVNFINRCVSDYNKRFGDINDNLIYVTIRTTDSFNYYKDSGTWHVDGFQGVRIARHLPEINYLWSNNNTTEFAVEEYDLLNFDYAKYNINSFFRDYTKGNNIFKCSPNGIYIMDPYMVHRAPICDFVEKRVFIRLNFAPVEIEDYTNTINPMLPRYYPKRVDIRDTLADFVM